jgi:hypothetical protein
MEKSKITQAEQDFDRNRLVMTPAIVFGSDGPKIGKVVEVADDYILIQKGFFFPREFFIPTWAIAREDPDRIDLRITKAAVQELGRADLPLDGDAWFDMPSVSTVTHDDARVTMAGFIQRTASRDEATTP